MTETQKALAKKKAEPIAIALAKKNLLHYIRYMFVEHHEVEFQEAWFHELICNALMKVLTGECTRLIINMPPSYGKTELAVKAFVSWALGKFPWMRFIYASYSDDLATETPADVKSMIGSEAYKKIFGIKKLNKTADKKWYLDKDGKKDGGMFSTTIAGGVTGFHGNVLIIDDPMKAIDKNSKSARKDTIDFYTGSASTRLKNNNNINPAIIVIMQRLHEKDLVGYLLEEEPELWTVISLTGYEKEETIYEFFDFYYKRPAYEPLNELAENMEALKIQEKVMKDNWSPQYMQDPNTIETGYVTDEDFATVATWELTEDNKCISIDPAQSIKQTSDNRAISVVGSCISIKKVELYNIYNTWFGKWTNEVFVDKIIEAMIMYPSIPVFMESSGGGILTEQALKLKLAIVNTELKLQGKPRLTNKITLFNPKTSISKNQKIDQSVTLLKNHQIRSVNGASGQEQIKKEYKGFHPEKDSKEDDCIETIANVVVNDFIKPKAPPKPKTTIRMGDPRRTNKQHGKYRI